MNAIASALVAAILLVPLAAQAQVTVSNAWVRATVAQQQATGVFMQLKAAQDSKLVSASSPQVPIVEVHEMAMKDNVMQMRQVPSIALPAGKTVNLEPGGYHVMLMGLKEQIKEGTMVPLTLVFEDGAGKRQTVDIQAPVRALNAGAPAAGHAGHGASGR